MRGRNTTIDVCQSQERERMSSKAGMEKLLSADMHTLTRTLFLRSQQCYENGRTQIQRIII